MMKENINSFSFRRVGLLIKRDVGENWKASLHSLGLAVAGFLFLMYISVLNSTKELMLYDTGIRILRFNYLEELLPSCIGMLTVLAMILICNAMGHMTTKGERTDFLILPARNIEKFIARYLYVFLLFVAIVSVAFVVADALHLLLFPLLGYGEYREVCDWLLPTLFDAGAWDSVFDADVIDRFSGHEEDWVAILFVCMMHVIASSMFALGGNYWRKHAFLKTVGVMMLLVVGGSWIAYLLLKDMPASLHREIFWVHYNSFIVCCSVLFGVLSVLCWYWAYRLFCRSQVVEPKRFSL